MTILVTGGAGYIGSHTVKSLLNFGFEVVVLDNLVYGHKYIVEDVLKVPLIIGEIGDSSLVAEILSGKHPATNGREIKAIIHFAAFAYVGESMIDPMKYYDNNVKQTITFFDSIIKESSKRNLYKKEKRHIPIVFSSSCATYGIPENIPIEEKSQQNPINPYGRSKLMIETIMYDLNKAYNLPNVIFRYFNAAGADPDGDLGEKHDPETHLIPLALEAISKKTPFFIYGNDYETPDGSCVRDFIHVVDIANAHVLGLKKVLENGGQFVYNLGTGKGLSVKEVLKTIEEVTKLKIKIEYKPRRIGDPPILVASPEKAKKDLDWTPNSSNIQNIIKDAWNWYKSIEST